VRRERRGIVTKAAEIHDLRRAGSLGSGCDRVGGAPVTLLEVIRPEGVHEVIDDDRTADDVRDLVLARAA
jgi:hypothetical protein